MNATLDVAELATPVGLITLAVRDERLIALCFEGGWERKRRALERRLGPCRLRRAKDPAAVVTRLRRYFDGELTALADIDVELHGTVFQLQVWKQLRQIGPGQTRSYGEVARAIGAPTAVRAVGTANGANPVAIVVPCHRVIGSNGSLTGFGGGLPNKRWLLDHEAAQLAVFEAARRSRQPGRAA